MKKFFKKLKGLKKEKVMKFVSLFAAVVMVMFGCASINSSNDKNVDELVIVIDDESSYGHIEEESEITEDDSNFSIFEESVMSNITFDSNITEESNDSIIEEISNDIMEESDIKNNDNSTINEEEEIVESVPDDEEKETKLVITGKKFTANTDLGKGMSNVTAEMIDKVTEHYSKYQSFDNPFKGKGYIFIEAQEKSGLDALFIYTLAVWESGWGTSKIARERCNYFGIGAWDIDLDRSLYMGDNLSTGIINGAIWIAEHYYENDQTTLTLMNTIPHKSYAPSNTQWIPHIVTFINDFCYILEV